MYNLYYLKDNGRYELFEKCYKYCKSKYEGVIRWEFIFDNTSVTNKSDNKEVTMDDLIAKIDEKIAEIEETK